MIMYSTPTEWFFDNHEKISSLKDHSWPEMWGHPLENGFKQQFFADPKEGKSADFTLSLPPLKIIDPLTQKSHLFKMGRLHAQLFKNETIKLHWDKYDPDQGQWFEHLWYESKWGKSLILGALISGGLYAYTKSNTNQRKNQWC